MISNNPYAQDNTKNVQQIISADNGQFYENYLNEVEKLEDKNKKRKGPSLQWIVEHEPITGPFLPFVGVSSLCKALSDYDSGLLLIAGHANAGKSTFMVHTMMDLIFNPLNTDLVVIDLSLDDPMGKRWEQYVANRSGLCYSDIHQMGAMSPYVVKSYYHARDSILEMIKQGRFWPLNAYHSIRDVKGDYRTMNIGTYTSFERLLKGAREKFPNPDTKIVIFVDAWQDVKLSATEMYQIDEYIRELAQLAHKLEIMIVGSAHFRKLGAKSEPEPEDIRGSLEVHYAASATFILRNDYKENPDNFLRAEEDDFTGPIIRLEVPKNKVSIEDRTMFYGLESGRCQLYPFTSSQYAKYVDSWETLKKDRRKR